MKKFLPVIILFIIASCNNNKSKTSSYVSDTTVISNPIPKKMVAGASLVGNTYYISPSGNDATGNGSQATPWKTLSKATLTVSNSGDIIHIIAGTYSENTACTLKVGVSIEGEGTASIIKANIGSGQFLSLQSPDNTNGNQSVSNFVIDGGYISESSHGSSYGIWITGRSNVDVHDMTITAFYQSGIIFDGNNVDHPNSDPGIYATGNKFRNNILTNCATVNNGYGNGCLMIGAQDGMVIQNNSIINTSRPAFKNGWPIKYWDNGYLNGCKILNNTLVKPPYQATYWGQNSDWDFCIELFNISGLEFAGNTVQGALDLNYNYKGNYSYSLWAHDNIFNHAVPNYTHPESAFILEFKAESVIIENNNINNAFVGISYNTRSPGDHGGYTYNCGTGGCSAITDNIVRNNLFTNLYAAPYGSTGGIVVQSEGTNDPYISNLQIYNNTFVAKSTQGSYTGMDFTSQGSGIVNGVSIHNNILQGFGSSIVGQAAKTQSGISITINDYYQTTAPSWAGSGVSISGNLNLNPQFDATYHSQNAALNGIGWNGGNNPLPCVFTYGNWTPCDNTGHQTRIYTAFPAGCTGTPPADSLTRSCDVANQPPVANAGADQTITLPVNTVTLTGAGTDPDGTVVSYQWKSGTTVVANTNVLILSNLVAGDYDYTLTVTDNLGAVSVPDAVHVKVLTNNPPPAANDTIPASVILYGSNLTRKNVSYFVKRPDGLFYDVNIKRDIYLYKALDGKWFYLGSTDRKWYQLF